MGAVIFIWMHCGTFFLLKLPETALTRVFRYSCGVLLIHMGVRCAGKHTTRSEAAALAGAEFTRLHQEADLKLMPALSLRRKK
jgi:hypothetical protein